MHFLYTAVYKRCTSCVWNQGFNHNMDIIIVFGHWYKLFSLQPNQFHGVLQSYKLQNEQRQEQEDHMYHKCYWLFSPCRACSVSQIWIMWSLNPSPRCILVFWNVQYKMEYGKCCIWGLGHHPFSLWVWTIWMGTIWLCQTYFDLFQCYNYVSL